MPANGRRDLIRRLKVNIPLLLHLVGVYMIYINDARSNKYQIVTYVNQIWKRRKYNIFRHDCRSSAQRSLPEVPCHRQPLYFSSFSSTVVNVCLSACRVTDIYSYTPFGIPWVARSSFTQWIMGSPASSQHGRSQHRFHHGRIKVSDQKVCKFGLFQMEGVWKNSATGNNVLSNEVT